MSENHQSSSSRGGKKINVRAARAEMVEKEFEYTNESYYILDLIFLNFLILNLLLT